MSTQLPGRIDPLRWVEKGKGTELSGTLPLSDLSRLRDSLTDLYGEVRFQLCFNRIGRVPAITGCVEARLPLTCQICLGPMECVVRQEIRLGIVSTLAEVDLLPDSFEPLLLEQSSIDPKEILEDELLLALPIVPQHGVCPAPSAVRPAGQAGDPCN